MKVIGTFILDDMKYTIYRVVQNGREYIMIHRYKGPMAQGFSNIFNQEYIEMDNEELVKRIYKDEEKLNATIAELFS